ncbi:hypothetical protein [Streptomyces sp. NPDC002952]|uniref:hypothetical protein n=1 Tax=Streptomyces sp. NPDC002952 TaxID=3364673 RepID=UPI003695BAF5
MQYTDRDGDLWESQEDDLVICTRSSVLGFEGVSRSLEAVEEDYGPLVPVLEAPDETLPTLSDVMDRADVFQSAHALVTGLEWGENASVYDVLSVAKWLEGEG